MKSRTRNLSNYLKYGKFAKKRKAKKGKKARKAQFFILSAFAIVAMLYLISRWIEPFTIVDTSQVALMDEIFIFNNIREKAEQVIKSSKNCEDIVFNLQEYRDFAIRYASEKGYRLNFTYFHTSCPVSSVDVNMTLRSPRTVLDSSFTVTWP